MAESAARSSASSSRAVFASGTVCRERYAFSKLAFVPAGGIVATIGIAEVIGEAIVFAAVDAAATGGVFSALRCHSHATIAATTRTPATPINILLELFLRNDMVRAFAQLIDNKPRIFRKIHSGFQMLPQIILRRFATVNKYGENKRAIASRNFAGNELGSTSASVTSCARRFFPRRLFPFPARTRGRSTRRSARNSAAGCARPSSPSRAKPSGRPQSSAWSDRTAAA